MFYRYFFQSLYLLLQCGHNVEEALRRRKMQAIPPTGMSEQPYLSQSSLSSPERSSGRAVALPPASALGLASSKCLSFYVRIFCDGQGTDRQAILSSDRSCYMPTVKPLLCNVFYSLVFKILDKKNY